MDGGMNLEGLLSPLGGDQPSGVELRNDARFHSIERLLAPAAREHRVKADGSVNEAAPPVDWSAVLSKGEALAADGRDLRLLVILLRGLYATEGFKGLSRGIGLLTRSVGEYWDSLHPALRDRDDPQMAAMARSNALRQLDNDDNGLLGDLRFGIAFSPRGIGPVSFDDVSVILQSDYDVLAKTATGLSKDEKDAIVARHQNRASRTRGACRAMATEEGAEITAMVADMGACLAGLETLCKTFGEKGGFDGTTGLMLPELTEFLSNCRNSLEKAIIETEAEATETGPESEPENEPAAAPPAAAPAGKKNTGGGNGAINSREDVEAALDRIVAFYERTEPSSPIPHVARRMRRMVAMDFLQLMQEVAPSGLKEFHNIAGINENKK